jgi:hypothetical protein
MFQHQYFHELMLWPVFPDARSSICMVIFICRKSASISQRGKYSSSTASAGYVYVPVLPTEKITDTNRFGFGSDFVNTANPRNASSRLAPGNADQKIDLKRISLRVFPDGRFFSHHIDTQPMMQLWLHLRMIGCRHLFRSPQERYQFPKIELSNDDPDRPVAQADL